MNEQEEIKFFISTMRDHALMHINGLTIYEQERIREAQDFFNKYNNYLITINNTNSVNNKNELLNTTLEFIKFKQGILNDILSCSLKINLSPGLIDHQINEALDFADLLSSNDHCSSVTNPTLYMKRWISDSAGHINSLISLLDESETLTIDKLKEHKHIFDNLMEKANEIDSMNNKVGIKKNTFVLGKEFIMKLEELITTFEEIGQMLSRCELASTGTLSDMLTTHFIREHQHVIRVLNHCLLRS